MTFILFIALYSFGRFFISFVRYDKEWLLGLNQAQLIAIILLVIIHIKQVDKLEFSTDVDIYGHGSLTDVQALTMISGSNTSFATEAALVQISTIEQFVDEEDSYQNTFDKIITTTTFNSNSWIHSAALGTL